MELVIIISIAVSFLASWLTVRKWIRKAPEIGILGFDMNKPGLPKVAEMGGVGVVFGFGIGMLIYMGLMTFYLEQPAYVSILAVLCSVLISCIIGMMDDMLGWKRIGIVGASNAYNMVAGYNGLEAGMGIVILSAMAYFAYISGSQNAMVLALCMVSALIAFLYFNWHPARVFPGDTMTYSVGALAACIAILGDMEKIAIVLFLPYAFDFLLQSKSGFKKEAFAKVNDDGSLNKPYSGIFHLTHLAIALISRWKGKVYERDVVLLLCGIEIAIAGLCIYAY